MISQTLKYLLSILALVFCAVWIAFGAINACALLAGVIWGAVNLYLIARIMNAFLVSKSYGAAILMMILKFPLLYGAGYLLLNVHVWNMWFLLAGPPLAFLLVVIYILRNYSMRSA
jgi:hypothetical protein